MENKQQASQQEIENLVNEKMRERLKSEQARKIRDYKTLNQMAEKGAILFTGSSLMEYFPICEMAMSAGIGKKIYNRGIGGTTTDDFLREIDTVLLDLQPAKVFINIGSNDMTERTYGSAWMEHLMENYETIVRTAVEKIPGVEMYLMAYYPTNHDLPWQDARTKELIKIRTKENIAECNRRVAALAEKYGQRYIDVNDGLADEEGNQKQEFSIDGVHMYAAAYEVVFRNIRKYL